MIHFVIEKKYGFNKMTIRTFITDHIKSWFIALLIGTPVLGLITWFYYMTGQQLLVICLGSDNSSSQYLSIFFIQNLLFLCSISRFLLPEGPLGTEIEAFAEKTGFKLRNIYVIDGSKRSTKANAYFSGFGPKKRIVLYDTLAK